MVYEIGESAGKVWGYLKEHPSATMENAGQALQLKEGLLYMAIGWLAREGKLAFEADGKRVKFSLLPE